MKNRRYWLNKIIQTQKTTIEYLEEAVQIQRNTIEMYKVSLDIEKKIREYYQAKYENLENGEQKRSNDWSGRIGE